MRTRRGNALAVCGVAAALVVGGSPPAFATVSGVEGRIAYVSGIDGDFEIYTVNPDGTDARNVSNAHGTEGLPIDDTDPAWSPDGRSLAFTRSMADVDADEPTIVSEVWVMDADGSNQMRVATGSQPAWSPDGRSIAFVRDAVGVVNGLPTTVIVVLSLATGSVTILTDPGDWVDYGGDDTSYDRTPVWSPDGSVVYFVRTRLPATPISRLSGVMSVEVSSEVTEDLGFTTRYIDHLDVSPRGDALSAITMDVPNPPRSIVLYGLDDGSTTVVQSDYYVAFGGGATFSPTGERLAVALTEGQMSGASFVWTMTTAGTDRVKVALGMDPAWQPVNPYAFGLVDPTQGEWHLRYPDGRVESFYYGSPGDVPFMGDWDCDGIDTPGLYRQSDGFVYLRNSNTQGIADLRFFFGNPGDVPLAGDFDGDGCDTVSVYRPQEARFFIINRLGEGDGGLGGADIDYVFGDPGDEPFAGDFDGDGVDTIGLHRDTTGLVYFRNSHTQGIADRQFIYGDPGDRIVANDWTASGVDTPGLFRPDRTTVYLRFTNTLGNADAWFMFGEPAWLPVAGTFDGS